MLTPKTGADASQRILTLLVMLQDRGDWYMGLGEKAAARLAKVPHLADILVAAMGKYGFGSAMRTVLQLIAGK